MQLHVLRIERFIEKVMLVGAADRVAAAIVSDGFVPPSHNIVLNSTPLQDCLYCIGDAVP